MRKLKKTKVKLLVTLLSFVLLFCGTMGSSLAWLLDKTDDVTNTFTPSTIGVTLTETKGTIDETDQKIHKFDMVPGWTIDKDPKVTVNQDSEDCYVFIKVSATGGDVKIDEKQYTFSDFIDYSIDTGWTDLHEFYTNKFPDAPDSDKDKYKDVYFRIVNNEDSTREFIILGAGGNDVKYDINATVTDEDDIPFPWEDNEVLTKPTVTKEMMDALTSDKEPRLEFTAYACQRWKQNEPATGADQEAVNAAQFTPYDAWNLAFANAN